jgi:hypothetical protein
VRACAIRQCACAIRQRTCRWWRIRITLIAGDGFRDAAAGASA